MDAVKIELAPAVVMGGRPWRRREVPLGSPNKLNRAVGTAVPLFTSVNHVVQFSSAATWGIEPIKLSPETGASIVIETICGADVTPVLSCAVTLKLNVPAAVATRRIVPVAGSSVSPGGNDPLLTVQLL